MIYRQQAMDWAVDFVNRINADPSKYLIYKTSRPVANIKHLMVTSTDLYPGNPAFKMKFPGDKAYTTITYRQALDDINALGTALNAHGLKGKRVAIVGENCYYWCLSYLTVVGGVGVVVPLDKELAKEDLIGLAKKAEVSCVIASKKYVGLFNEMKAAGEGCLECVVGMYTEPGEGSGELSLKGLMEEGRAMIAGGDHSYIDCEINEEEMSILLFTSGTTGLSKGVMLSHKNIVSDLMSAPNMLEVLPTDTFFNVLPLHHTYACTCDFLEPLYKGACIGFCEGLKYIQKNLQELQPTLFLGVPAIFEALYKTINKTIRKQGKDKTVAKVLKINRVTKKIGIDLVPKFLGKITGVFGGRMRTIIAGGAPMDPVITNFFCDLGFRGVQGYGLTECSPMAALNPDIRELANPAAAGRILPNFDAKIINPGEDGIGEICIKGEHVMLGYYQMPEQTAEVLQDGWYHTGDLGYIDKDRFIFITGRMKNVIITANGKNVYPEELEYKLSLSPYVSESMVWSEDDEVGHNKNIVATIIPEAEEVAAVLGEDADDPDKVLALLQKEVDALNDKEPLFKKINKVVLRTEPFVKNTSAKIKRFATENKKLN
ncbi:MAG: AMP-binding protein [Clostridia bacterium]|nr:AMP-binding protein [Clostridia bacterium]